MRLIDADKLPKYDGYALSAVEVAKAVESAPTIEAVPEEKYQRMVQTVANLTEKVGELMEGRI